MNGWGECAHTEAESELFPQQRKSWSEITRNGIKLN